MVGKFRTAAETNLAAASILRVRIAQFSAQGEVYFAILAVIVSVPCCLRCRID
jgi:hypothetical protein